MKTLIVGSTGLLGSAFEGDLLQPSKQLFDITNYRSMAEYIEANHADVIINCAGLVGTLSCQNNERLAYEINYFGVKNLIDLCSAKDIKLIHISSIYSGDENIYALTKLLSERIVEQVENYAVIRLPWLFGRLSNSSFITTIFNSVRSGLDLELFADVGHTAYSKDIAKYILDNIQSIEGKVDLYNEGDVTKKDIAKYISNFYNKPVLITEIPRKIPLVLHPHFNQYTLRPWQEALGEYLNELGSMQPATENSLASR